VRSVLTILTILPILPGLGFRAQGSHLPNDGYFLFVEIRLALSLPRDELSIPVVRRLCTQSLRVLGAADECAEDLELALTEACTNVLRHAKEGDDYEVVAGIDGEAAVLEVVDRGPGFDANALARAASGEVEPDAETGRGLQIMRALMDSVEFESRPGNARTVVRLEKELQWREDAAATRLVGKEHELSSDGEATIDLTVSMRALDSR
jgi:serine/threonine-protein kinase RsbW